MSYHTCNYSTPQRRTMCPCENPMPPYNSLLDKMKRSIYNSLCWNANDSETNIHKCHNRIKSGKIHISAEFKLPPKTSLNRSLGRKRECYEKTQSGDATCNKRENKDTCSDRNHRLRNKKSRCTVYHDTLDNMNVAPKCSYWRRKGNNSEKIPDGRTKYPANHALYQPVEKKESCRKEKELNSNCRRHLRNLRDKNENNRYVCSKEQRRDESHKALSKKTDDDDDERTYYRKYINERKTNQEKCTDVLQGKTYKYDKSESNNTTQKNLRQVGIKALQDECYTKYTLPTHPKYDNAKIAKLDKKGSFRAQISDSGSVCTVCREQPGGKNIKPNTQKVEPNEKHCKQVYELSKEQCKSFREKGYIKVNVKVKPNVSVSDFNIIIKKDKSSKRSNKHES
ncbi:hypothetical protein M8J76_010442 [Diaphorina citri]|nr:hypothetical protein M8J76_010442 [Diaphorina citri]KAI5752153.1 hypothetical protein M8J77_014318 [Diaphorina citri]